MHAVRSRFPRVVPIALLACALAVGASAQQAPRRAPTPVPSVTGPITVTETSYPYMSAAHLLEPMDLAAAGYVEEEYFVSGRANVYDWGADGTLSVRTPDAPYTTRILVRRPAAAARFSGNVVVEIMHTPNAQDFSLMWGWAHDYFLEHGDAYVAVTVMPVAAKALKIFDPVRYAPISFANPAPGGPCPVPGTGNAVADPSMEEGLRWDMISQVGALLKSTAPGRPLAGLKVEYLFMTTQDPILQTYINAIHRTATLASGRPVYDGYVVKGGVRAARIHQCAAAPATDDTRNAFKNVGVPIIHLQMEGDFPGAFAGRRPDSDEPADRFRLWEVAGTAHFDSAGYRTGFPSLADMTRGGLELPKRAYPPDTSGFTFEVPLREPDVAQCSPPVTSEQPILGYVFHAAFMNLDQWVRKGLAPPRAARLELTNPGTPMMAVAADEFGNGKGGLRTPYVDVPTSTYLPFRENTARLCRQFGAERRFTWQRLETLYGSYAAYTAKVTAAVDRAVQDRWLTPTDGRKVKAELLATAAQTEVAR